MLLHFMLHHSNHRTQYYTYPTLLSQANVTSKDLLESFRGEEGREKWRMCCKSATECCQGMLTTPWPEGRTLGYRRRIPG